MKYRRLIFTTYSVLQGMQVYLEFGGVFYNYSGTRPYSNKWKGLKRFDYSN